MVSASKRTKSAIGFGIALFAFAFALALHCVVAPAAALAQTAQAEQAVAPQAEQATAAQDGQLAATQAGQAVPARNLVSAQATTGLTAAQAATSQSTSLSAAPALTKYQQAAHKRKLKKKPLVAIADRGGTKGMARYLRKCGFKVKLVRKVKSLNVEKFDGIVIPGGGDVTPSVYGAKRSKKTYGTSLKRDKLQIAAVKRFANAGKPVLGICRGNQVINVAFGGTLTQHINGWHKRYRSVFIAKGSWLRGKLGATESVWHSHHQCVRRLGKGLIDTQWDMRDGCVEAIQHQRLPVFGIQWHPEEMGARGRKVGKLFKKECLRRMP